MPNEDAEATKSNLIKAVNSIPAYVNTCELFIVLAPSLVHEDTGAVCDLNSWKQRGWCRTEMGCRALSTRANSDEILYVRSSTQVKYINSVQWMFNAPCRGQFTVEADRSVVNSVLEKAMDKKIAFE